MASTSHPVTDRPLLQLRGVSLDYGMVRALDNVDLSLCASEIHAIVGEHGAGKSSIARVAAGFLRPSSGEILIDGAILARPSIEECHRRGIELVQQNINLFEDLSVGYNLFMNNGRKIPGPFYHHARVMREAQSFLDSFGIDLDAHSRVRHLHFSERVLVDILKGIGVQPRLLILDESLEKLTSDMLDRVVSILKRLRERGGAVLFITHRIDDLYDLADRVTILRDGRVLLTDSVNNIDKINLIRLAYTQFLRKDPLPSSDSHFYQLMKYNEAILQKLPVNLLVADREGLICLTNEAATRYFRISRPIDEPRPLGELIPPGNETVLSRISEALARRQETVFDVQLRLGEATRILNVISYPIQDGPTFIGSILILNDISEHEKLKAQVNVSERLASVGLLAAGVAHEINNPLEIIFNYLDLLKFSVKAGEAREQLIRLEEEMENIESIVSNLVTFSDSVPARAETFDAHDVIDNLLRLVRITSDKQGLRIEYDADAEELPVRGSKAEIRQVFLNILKNSFEATPCGGLVRISAQAEGKDGHRRVRVVFSDSGPGIPTENLKDIFLPFYSTKRNSGRNRGLGLYLSYQIVRKYNGDITVENNTGRGCTVTVLLPSRGDPD